MNFSEIEKDKEIREYIIKSDLFLERIGYTEHSFAHVKKVATVAGEILSKLGYSKKEVELARIAGFMHDIGNMINRVDHSHIGGILAFNLLKERDFSPEEIAWICGAIGNHDEKTGNPVSPICAALILADKSDVRRSRVREKVFESSDIHDRVNFAVTDSSIDINLKNNEATLKMTVDTEVSSVMDYFEIFMERMLMCKRAAEYLKLKFAVIINETKVL